MARVRERQSQRPGGANFVGPMPMPVVERPAMPANSDGVGRLVPSSSGGVKWQAGAGPGATPPPQSQPAMPVIPAAMAAPRPMQAPGSRIAQSPANRPYAEMPGSSGSLANRGVRAIGRSANDPERALEMAMRRARSQGDLEGAARMAQSNAWLNARMGGGGMGPMNRPAMPAMPGLVPAQTQRKPTWAGSMPPSDTGVESSGAMQPRSMPLMPSSVTNSQPSVPRPSTEPEPVDMFQRDPLGNYVNPQAAMVPSGFNAMNEFNAAHGLPPPPPGLYGAEAPPLVSSTPIPGTDQVMPMVKGEPKGAPVNRAQPPKPATWEAPKMYDETIPEVRDANGNVTRPAQTRQYYFVQDPQTGKPRKEYALDANGDGVPDNQQPGWQSWLDAQP